MVQIPLEKGKTNLTCKHCSNAFSVSNRTIRFRVKKGQAIPQYCSKKCRTDFEGQAIELPCDFCGKLIRRTKYYRETREYNFCSLECMGDAKRTGSIRQCDKCKKEFYRSQCEQDRYTNLFCSNDCRISSMFSVDGFDGEKFKGISKVINKLRKNREICLWKKRVLGRDKKCQDCQTTINLHVHHITTLAQICRENDMDESRILSDPRTLELTNGIVLCGNCHFVRHKSLHVVTHESKSGELLETPEATETTTDLEMGNVTV